MASLPILAAVPELILLPLLPLALAFFALVLLNPRPAQHGEQRFSLLIPAEEKDRLAVPLGGLRPGSYASRHTTVRAPSNATSLFRSELGIVGPAVAAGMCFGASALCAVASLAGEEAATGALSRSSGVLNTLGVFFAGLTPILFLTRRSLTHIFPSCATLQPLARLSRAATPEPYFPRKRSSYRVGLLFLGLFFSTLYTLLSTALAPSVPLPSGALAAGPAAEMLALLLPLQSVLHLSPHRPILIPALIAHFFGLVGRAVSLARALEPANTPLSSGLQIAGAACDLLWVSVLLLCTAVLAATPLRNASPVPAHYNSPAQLALMQASHDRPAPPTALGIPPSPQLTNDSVLDISASRKPASSSSSSPSEVDLPRYTQAAPVEAHDPTALLRSALFRSLDSPSQQSAFESIRSTLPADFTLALQGYQGYSPALSQAFAAPPVPELPAHITPPRPRTAGTAQSLRHTISRLVRTPQRPRTAPAQAASAENDCSTLPSSRLTPLQGFTFDAASAAARQEEREWVMDLEASPTGQIVATRRAREEAMDVKLPSRATVPRDGVMVEVETESDAYESAEEGARKE